MLSAALPVPGTHFPNAYEQWLYEMKQVELIDLLERLRKMDELKSYVDFYLNIMGETHTTASHGHRHKRADGKVFEMHLEVPMPTSLYKCSWIDTSALPQTHNGSKLDYV